MRAVGDGFQDFSLRETRDIHREVIEVAGAVVIGEQHGAGDQRAVGLGQFGLVDAAERFGGLGLAELEAGSAGDGDAAGLAFDIQRVDTAQLERGLMRIELLVVGDDQRVATPGLVLQRDAPDDSVGVPRGASRIGCRCHLLLSADVRAGEVNVLPTCRQPEPEFLEALVDDRVTDGRAAPEQAVADCDEVENLGNDARLKFFSRERERPIGLVRDIGEQFVGAVGEVVDRDFAQPIQFGSLEADARG